CRGGDAVAGLGMHAALVGGPPWRLGAEKPEEVAGALQNLTVTLRQGEEIKGTGAGSNVLGSPLLTLGYLARVLAEQPWAPPLTAGEVVTTRALTPPPPPLPRHRPRLAAA